VVDVLAEDDGLGEAVGGLEELGDLGGDQFGALFEDEVAVEVASLYSRSSMSWPYLSVLPSSGRQPSRSLSRPMRTTL
jgi:hypothetical protein